MAELATGYVQIIPSMKGAPQTIRNELTGASETAGAKSGSIFGSTMKKYISAAAIGTALTKSLTEGAALEQALGGVETLYKEHSKTVIDYADQAWKTAGISANQYMEQSTSFAAALLNSLGGDTAKAAEAANTAIIDMADNANKMGTSLESIQMAYQGFAKQNYTMLDNLKLGYGGTKTEMERLLADAEKFSGVKYDINNLADVYDAIHVVQTELDITGTTAKEGATTLSGSFMAMAASAQNLLGNLALGRNVGKSMKALVKSVSTFLSKNLIPAIGNVIKSIPELFTSINWVKATSELGKQTSKFVDQALKWAEGLAQGIAKGMPKFIQQLPKFISNVADIVNKNAPKILATGVKIVVTLAKGLIQAIPTFVKTIPQLTKAAAKAFTAFGWGSLGKSAITLLKNGVTKAAGGIGSALKSRLTNIKSAFTSPFASAKETITKLVQGMINKIKGLFPFKINKLLKIVSLPKFSLKSGKKFFDGLGKMEYPTGITQHAEGGIFTQPTLLGSHLFGEAGNEAIVPLDAFWNKLDSMANGMGNAPIYITVQSVLDGEIVAENTIRHINGHVQRFGTSPINV